MSLWALYGEGNLDLYDNLGSVGTHLSGQSGNYIAFDLGVGRVPLRNDLEVDGNASKASAGEWLANSDARIKTQVRTVTNALETLARVRPVAFRYTKEYLAAHPKLHDQVYYNVIAQEFATVFPDYVTEGGDTLPNGENILQVDTQPASITALAAIQELHALVKAQQERIEQLEERLSTLTLTPLQPTPLRQAKNP